MMFSMKILSYPEVAGRYWSIEAVRDRKRPVIIKTLARGLNGNG